MSLIPDTDQAPGYCSIATAPLTPDQISRIVSAATTGNETAGITTISEKELGLKGQRKLHILDTKEQTLVVEYVGVRKAKFVKKDLERFTAMKDAYEEQSEDDDVLYIVLMKDDWTICRRNSLAALHRLGVVVMRCPAGDTDSDSDDSSSSDDSE